MELPSFFVHSLPFSYIPLHHYSYSERSFPSARPLFYTADAIQFTVDQTALAKSKKADVDAKIGESLLLSLSRLTITALP